MERSHKYETSLKQLNSQEVLETWVAQEGDRYTPILIERGFLQEEEKGDPDKVKQASKEWRSTYVADLNFEHRVWKPETVEDITRILEWRLGGWNGWLPYRSEGVTYTTFKDIVEALDHQKEGIPPHHQTVIPEIARTIVTTLKTKTFFAFRCNEAIAVLDGTHTLARLAYAIQHGLPLPSNVDVYVCELEAGEQKTFDRFCERRPLEYGRYHKKQG